MAFPVGAAGADVVATFEGRVWSAQEHRGAELPGAIAKGDRVIGCFRFRPEDVTSEQQVAGFVRYLLPGVPGRNVLAMKIGDLVWRSGEEVAVSVGSADPATLPAAGGLIVWYSGNAAALLEHPGLPPGGRGEAGVHLYDFKAPIGFVASSGIPGSRSDLNFARLERIFGTVSGHLPRSRSVWTIVYEVDPENMFIGGEPVVPDGRRPGSAEEAAGLCGAGPLSDAAGDIALAWGHA